MKTLIVYYSHGGNTGAAARRIAEQTGAPCAALTPAAPYPGEYKPLAAQAWQEIQNGFLPPLADIPDLTGVTHLLLGTPNWCGTMAPPVAAFLAGVSTDGLRILPFCTHGGGGPGKIAADLQKLCPGADIGPLLSIKGTELAVENLRAWLAVL